MRFRSLPLLLMLFCSLAAAACAQSLGDVARELKAEKGKQPAHAAKVYTNDDLESTHPAPAPAKAESDELPATDPDAITPPPAAPTGPTAAEREEAARSKRTAEINKHYTDRVQKLQEQLNAAQVELAKAQRQQAESVAKYRATVGAVPGAGPFEQEQREFVARIESLRATIAGLNSQMEDAREAARHAGVHLD